MTGGQATLLGAIAGSTIFLGLPVGRITNLSPRVRSFLTTTSAGILLFIFWDVLSHAFDQVEGAMPKPTENGSFLPVIGRGLALAVGLAIGALGLSWAQRALMARRPVRPIAGGSSAARDSAPFDAAAIAAEARRAAHTLGILIASAIGIHNFGEGLAIGAAAKSGAITLAGTLIIGFALHNATEGFGIVGSLGSHKPSWRWLGLAGLLGGGPTFLGTLLGYQITSPAVQLAFYALAAGSILFVVGELWSHENRKASRELVMAGLVFGLLLGIVTDLVVAYAGG